MSVKELLLALVIVAATLIAVHSLAHACEITPSDWAEVEEEMSDGE